MSENQLLNEIIRVLEESQKIQIWHSQNEIKPDTIEKLKELVKLHVNSEINKHVIQKFGISFSN